LLPHSFPVIALKTAVAILIQQTGHLLELLLEN
jgi:hypothetical protein